MGLDVGAIWNVLDKLLDAGNDFVEAQVETAYGALHNTLKAKVEKTETEFDDNAMKTVEIGFRDKLIKLYPLEEFPPD